MTLDSKFIPPKDFKIFGESSLLILWEEKIDPQILESILSLKASLKRHYNSQSIEFVNAYASLLVIFKEGYSPMEELKFLKRSTQETTNSKLRKPVVYEVPVCYHTSFGLDLEVVANRLNYTVSEVIRLHTEGYYRIYFHGFLPGFFYLGGLPETLVLPRRSSPRMQVSKGSVAIGGSQTGIYPQESPGGWHIIGRTPVAIFNINNNPPTIAQSGDIIKFKSIDLETYNHIARVMETGSYHLKRLNND